LELFLRAHGKPTPQFKRQIAEKTLLVGLTSTVFRDAIYTSHEVTIDKEQLAWFEETVKSHPAEEGWKIFVFTHAPPNGTVSLSVVALQLLQLFKAICDQLSFCVFADCFCFFPPQVRAFAFCRRITL